MFDPGEAFQFDWSHEWVEMGCMPVKVKVAHLRLCFSRLFVVIAYPRETQEMVFDAHIRAFEFFGGSCRKGIYDNLKAAVSKVFSGKERSFNDCFSQLCSHYGHVLSMLVLQLSMFYVTIMVLVTQNILLGMSFWMGLLCLAKRIETICFRTLRC
jgi:hypothetical protein